MTAIDAPRDAKPRKLTGWHVLAMFVVFFGVDIAVNTYFITSAYKTFPGETSSSPYEDGLAWDTTLAHRRAESKLAWRIAAGSDAAGHVRVDASDRTGAPLAGLQVSAHIERPATEAGQRDLTLHQTVPGVYVGQTAPLSGAWVFDVTARDAQGHEIMAERRVLTQ